MEYFYQSFEQKCLSLRAQRPRKHGKAVDCAGKAHKMQLHARSGQHARVDLALGAQAVALTGQDDGGRQTLQLLRRCDAGCAQGIGGVLLRRCIATCAEVQQLLLQLQFVPMARLLGQRAAHVQRRMIQQLAHDWQIAPALRQHADCRGKARARAVTAD